jgi:DNA-binding MarR family transcriptional regulator
VQNGSVTEPSNETRAAVLALTRVARLLERTLAAEETGLNISEFRMLSAVAGGEARASRLAHRLAVGKPTVSSTVDALVRRGLLTRTAHDADQRAVDLALTAEGEAHLAAAEAALAARVASIAERTPDPASTLAALAAFGDALEERMAEVAASRTAARGATR